MNNGVDENSPPTHENYLFNSNFSSVPGRMLEHTGVENSSSLTQLQVSRVRIREAFSSESFEVHNEVDRSPPNSRQRLNERYFKMDHFSIMQCYTYPYSS